MEVVKVIESLLSEDHFWKIAGLIVIILCLWPTKDSEK